MLNRSLEKIDLHHIINEFKSGKIPGGNRFDSIGLEKYKSIFEENIRRTTSIRIGNKKVELFHLYEWEVREMVETHTRENPVNFSGYKIGEYTFSGLDLENGIFSGADLSGVTFDDCILKGCCFGRALNVRAAKFRGCTLDRATSITIWARGGQLPRDCIIT